MAIDFPNSPTINDTHVVGGMTWIWNGTAWVSAVAQANAFGNVATTGQTTVAADSSSDTLNLSSSDVAITTNATTDTVTLTLATVNSNVGSFGSSIDIPVVTVNAKGLVTAASSSAVRTGSTTQTGVLQLEDSTASTSTSTAATPAAVKTAYDLALAALPKSGGTMTGSITLRAGTATAGTAPVYLTSGTNLTTAAAGAVEWNGTNLFITQTTGPTRKTVAFTDSNITGTASNVTGTVAVSNGGTGQTTYTDGQILIGNTTGNTLAKSTLTGTTNQVTVTNGAGSITLSLPQSIHTAATPTFAGLTLSGLTGYLKGNGASALTASSTVPVGDLTGTLGATNGGTGQSTWTLGDLLYSSAANTLAKLGGNTTAVKQFLTQTGTGTVSAAPAWGAITAGDLPGTLNAFTVNGAITFTTTASITTALTSATVFNTGATTVNIAGAGTTVSIGAATGTTAVNNTLNIVGSAQRNGTTARMLVYSSQADATTQLTPTSTTFVDVVGATLSPTLVSGDIVVITAVMDMETASVTGVGTVSFNGVDQATPLIVMGTTASTVRATITQQYIFTYSGSTGAVVCKLRARCGAGFSSGVTVRIDHTTISVMVFR